MRIFNIYVTFKSYCVDKSRKNKDVLVGHQNATEIYLCNKVKIFNKFLFHQERI